MFAGRLLCLLFPHVRSVRIDDVVATDRVIRFDVTTCAPSAACPVCGQSSSRVHSRYQRFGRRQGGRPAGAGNVSTNRSSGSGPHEADTAALGIGVQVAGILETPDREAVKQERAQPP